MTAKTDEKFEELFGMSEYEFGKKLAEVIDRKIEKCVLPMRVKMREMERTIKELQFMTDQMRINQSIQHSGAQSHPCNNGDFRTICTAYSETR